MSLHDEIAAALAADTANPGTDMGLVASIAKVAAKHAEQAAKDAVHAVYEKAKGDVDNAFGILTSFKERLTSGETTAEAGLTSVDTTGVNPVQQQAPSEAPATAVEPGTTDATAQPAPTPYGSIG